MNEEQTDWFKQPMVNMIVGFILTGVLGTAVTQHFLDQHEQEKMRAQEVLEKKQAIQQFSKLNETRKVRAEMMLASLRKHSNDEELKSARQEYDKAYVAWSIERPGMLLLFRELLSSENYQLIESRFKDSLMGKIFNPMRLCLTTAIDLGDNRVAVNKTLEACRIDELLDLSSTCGLALASAVSDLARTHIEWASTEDTAELKKRVQESIDKQCP
jgi:hypothetical protein